jgi:hypothetical protein
MKTKIAAVILGALAGAGAAGSAHAEVQSVQYYRYSAPYRYGYPYRRRYPYAYPYYNRRFVTPYGAPYAYPYYYYSYPYSYPPGLSFRFGW